MTLPGLGSSYVGAGAIFDEPNRFYRYRLWRDWAETGTRILWIMLNPSIADEHVLDSTLKKVEGFSRRWGHAGFEVVNVFALRSTTPKALYDGDVYLATKGYINVGNINPAGERDGGENDQAIGLAAALAHTIVVGWGTEKIARERGAAIATMLRRRDLYCLGTNNDGSPVHPLYIPYERSLTLWRKAA